MRINKIQLDGFKRMKLNDYHSITIDFDSPIQQILGTNGSGKAQPLISKIKIPGGWTTMGQIQVGDEVVAKDGSVCKVTHLFPQGMQQTYRVMFNDGRSSVCTLDHLWKVSYLGKTEVITLKEIYSRLKKDNGAFPITIDTIDPEIGEDIELPRDPYMVGLMIDPTVMEWIPEVYLQGSHKQREDLFRGLLDNTDFFTIIERGYYETNRVSYIPNKDLAKQIQYLIRSLGMLARLENNHLTLINNQLTVKTIYPNSIEECQCIRIDNPEHLYITDDFIVTHNSSLLSELNPLAGDHKDFDKGGKKHIWISHRGHEYECISDFSEGNKHTFIKDGITLNELGNAKIQNELVEKEFNYNKKKRDLLLGRVKFTTMRPDQRREWFTHLSDVNYDYAIHVFLKIKERLRDITGSLREHKRRVVLESAKVLKEEEINKLKSDIKTLHDEITELLDKRENPGYTVEASHVDQPQLIDEITSISKKLLTKKIYQPVHVNSVEELNEKIQEVKNQIIIKEATIDQLQKEASKVQKEANILKQSGLSGIIEIDLKQVELQKLKSNKFLQIINDIQFNDPIASRTGLEAVQGDLIDLCIQLPINTDKSISQAYSNDLRSKLEINFNRKRELQNILNKKNVFKLHLEEHKTKDFIECPKCTHQWKLGYDEVKYQSVVSDVLSLEKDLEDIEKEAKDLNEKIQFVNEYAQLFRRYKLISQSRPDLKPLFDYIDKEEILINNPKSIQSLLERVKNSLSIQCELVDINKELIKIEEIKKLAEDSSLQTMNQVNEKLDYYALEVNRVTKEKRSLELTVNDYLFYKNEIQFVLDTSKRLEILVNSKDELDIKTIKAVVYEVITKELKVRQSTLAMKEDILSEVMNQKNIVIDLESQIERLAIDQDALNILVDQISPKEGLIAEGLFGFMKHFIKRWNRVIDKVWTYPLEILPCSIEGTETVELDYKFPLVVSDNDNTKDDVSLGSTGMQEIINLAFVLVAMQCMDMKDYPVMLDEFSNTFDETHRTLAVELIKNLLDHYSFSQLFIVSHYLTLHGALTNAQICLLNDTNLSVSTVVNKHVQFK